MFQLSSHSDRMNTEKGTTQIEKEVFGDLFPGVEPGWILNWDETKVLHKNAAPSYDTPLEIVFIRFDQEQLRIIVSKLKDSAAKHDLYEEFEKSEEKHCFQLRYSGEYSSVMNNVHCPTEGIVTEVKYSKSIVALICSSENKSFERCLEFVNKILEGDESQLDQVTIESCKKCFLYHERLPEKSRIQSFDRVTLCLKEFARIVKEMKSRINYDLYSFKFLKNIYRTERCTAEEASLSVKNMVISTNERLASTNDEFTPDGYKNKMPESNFIKPEEKHVDNIGFESSSSETTTSQQSLSISTKTPELPSTFPHQIPLGTMHQRNNQYVNNRKITIPYLPDPRNGPSFMAANSQDCMTNDNNSFTKSIEKDDRSMSSGKDNDAPRFKAPSFKALSNNVTLQEIPFKHLETEDLKSGRSSTKTKKFDEQQNIIYRGRKITFSISYLNGFRTCEIGTKIDSNKGKVILMLGATGCGKTALVNLAANFYFGSPSAEEEKLFIDESKSKTDRVTVYTFYPENENHIPITVIDTPGLNDSTGAEIHDHVDTLKSFLAVACSHGLEIHAIGFVAQAHLVRLTSSEKLVMDYVTSLFGADIQKHIIVMVTFSDHQKTPPVIEAMEQYGLKSPFFVKFNNTLLIDRKGEVDDLDTINWRTGLKSWKKCLKLLSEMKPLSTAAISTVQIEVFNKSVIARRFEILRSEISILITMYSKKTYIKELYSDEDLRKQRNKVWMASNVVFNLKESVPEDLKETFLIKTCQDSENSSSLLLFILLDSESAFRNNVVAIIKSLDEYDKALVSFAPLNASKESASCCSYRGPESSVPFESKCDKNFEFPIPQNFRRTIFETGYQSIKDILLKCFSNGIEFITLEEIGEHLIYNEADDLNDTILKVWHIITDFHFE